jgi:2-aminoadipate transaminase
MTVIDLIDRGRKPKFIYIIPDFQNPSGVNLSLARRHEILGLAHEFDLLIIEDSPYRELRFSGHMIPSLRALDSDMRVIQMKTFSKVFSPGFRIGWVTGPAPVIEKMVMAKQGTDLCTSAFVSIVAAYLLQDGLVERQIEISRKLYAQKASTMIEALEAHMPEEAGITWSKPEGGMFLWLRLPEYMDATEMIGDAVRLRVGYVVGTCFYHDGSGRNEIRLNYSYPSEEQIVEGIKRLSKLVRDRIQPRDADVRAARG